MEWMCPVKLSAAILYKLWSTWNVPSFPHKNLPIERRVQLFIISVDFLTLSLLCVSQARRRMGERFWSSVTPSIAATAQFWHGSESNRCLCSSTTQCWRWAALLRWAGTRGSCTAGTPLNTPPCCRMRASVTSLVSVTAGDLIEAFYMIWWYELIWNANSHNSGSLWHLEYCKSNSVLSCA